MTTEMQVRPEMNLTVPGGFMIEGMEGLGLEDMIVPRWDILQPSTTKKGIPGYLCLNLSGETRESIDAVILRISKTRVLWSGNRADKVPECSSIDCITGRTHGDCAGCEFNFFDKTGIAKVCKAGYTLLCCDPENPDMLFLISMYGVSVSAAKVLNSQFIQKRRPPFTAVVTFRSVERIGEKGKYYVHDPKVTSWLSPDSFAPFQELSRLMNGVAIREVDADVVAEATHAHIEPAPTTPRRARPEAKMVDPDPTTDVPWEELTGEGPAASKTAAGGTAAKAVAGGGKRNLPF